KIEREAEHNARFDADLEPVVKRLQALAAESQDLTHTLRAWTQRSEADPGRQEEVETRVQRIRRLEAKYGKSIEDLIAYRQTLEILLAANPGEPALPLRKVASGGEMSRTMLALKSVLAGHVEVGTTMVFDEIDANVGGRLGDVLGIKLAALGREHQVICVTHLPQVAVFAKHHWTIRKGKQGKRTTTTITYLE